MKILCLVILGFFVSCSSTTKIHKDSSTGKVIKTLAINIPKKLHISADLFFTDKDRDDDNIDLNVFVSADDFHFRSGDSLVVTADGVEYKFTRKSSLEVRSSTGVETEYFPVSRESLKKIASSQKVHIQIQGIDSDFEADMSRPHIDALKNFIL